MVHNSVLCTSGPLTINGPNCRIVGRFEIIHTIVQCSPLIAEINDPDVYSTRTAPPRVVNKYRKRQRNTHSTVPFYTLQNTFIYFCTSFTHFNTLFKQKQQPHNKHTKSPINARCSLQQRTAKQEAISPLANCIRSTGLNKDCTAVYYCRICLVVFLEEGSREI